MKKLTSAAIFIAGVLAASPSAFGQFTLNDLYMGFQNGGAGASNADYIINLGPASSIVGSPSVVNLSGDFSLSDFNLVLGGSSSMWAGVVGGSSAANPSSDIYLTQQRTSNFGNPALAGSSVSAIFSRADDNDAASVLGSLNVSLSVGGVLDPSKSWESSVEPANDPGSFYGQTDINPDSPVSTSSVLYEDLWYNSNSSISGSSGFTYLGYFTIDPSASYVNFNPSAAPVPEPGTFAIATLGGFSLLLLRRRFGHHHA